MRKKCNRNRGGVVVVDRVESRMPLVHAKSQVIRMIVRQKALRKHSRDIAKSSIELRRACRRLCCRCNVKGECTKEMVHRYPTTNTLRASHPSFVHRHDRVVAGNSLKIYRGPADNPRLPHRKRTLEIHFEAFIGRAAPKNTKVQQCLTPTHRFFHLYH